MKPAILLRSGWQNVNIGDIAHSPGLLHALATRLPETDFIYWPVSPDPRVEAMIATGFPTVSIVNGELDEHGLPTTPALAEAWNRAGILIHGSGPSLMQLATLRAWRHTDRPYGAVGITVQDPTDEQVDLLRSARFTLTRETASLGHIRRAGGESETTQFCPDGTWAFHLRDEVSASAFLRAHHLDDAPFLVVVPRLRKTPYHRIHQNWHWTPERAAEVDRLNERTAEPDHAKLREMIVSWVRETKLNVLLCAEMTYAIHLLGPLLYDQLPEDVKPKVVLRKSWWLPDEAASIYARAASVVSIECHSPILAATTGTPFLYVRQPEDTIKGQMYNDLGFARWRLEIDQVTGAEITHHLMEQWHDRSASQDRINAGLALAHSRFSLASSTITAALGTARPSVVNNV